MKQLLKTFIFIFSFSIVGQQITSQQTIKNKVEGLILQDKIDSASYYLNRLENSDYKSILEKVVSNKQASYEEYHKFFSSLSNRTSLKYERVSNFIDEIVKVPEKKDFNEFFFMIKSDQIYNLRDNVSVEDASKKHRALEQYVSNFDESKIEIQKARLRLQTHPIVIYLIERNVKKGKQLVLDCLEKSRALEDIELQIMFLYHLTDFLILEGKLQEYIDVSEEGLKLEEQIPNKSPYYLATLQHLIDAYIYKGGYSEKVMLLLDELYNDSSFQIQTYVLYLKLLANARTSTAIKKAILEKFEADNVKQLVAKFQVLGKDLNPNDRYKLLFESSKVLEVNNYFNEAIALKDEAIILTRKIYSEDLSKSLANFRVEETMKTKQKEIKYEKEKNKLYSIILVLVVLLLAISLVVILKVKKQSRELTKKNKIINKALKERELLIKEVHHRVKNNFQIITSLLELQTKGISDKKALELANEGKNRVKSMAIIHQKLYQNKTGKIDFKEYIILLIRELCAIYTLKNKVETTIELENMFFDVDTAIPLGLITNEIVTNAFKYAFQEDKNNKLFISIKKEDSDFYKLIIQDNGPGITESLDVTTAKSLGLRLVNRLVKQLQGNLVQSSNNGARFEIYFKDKYTRKQVS